MNADSYQWELPPRKRHLHFLKLLYLLCTALTLVSLITFFCPSVLIITQKFSAPVLQLFNKPAVVAVIGAVGAPAVVMGSLLGVTEQQVYGERIGTLLNWGYPHFFKLYFFLFIPSVLLGIYEGSVGTRRLPVALILITILIETLFIVYVCYIFLVPGKARECLALTYYAEFMEWSTQKADSLSAENARAKLRQNRQMMLKLAGALARRESEGRAFFPGNILALWISCMKSCGTAEQMLTDNRAKINREDYCCLLAKEFWESLSRKSGKPLQQLEILTAMLFSHPVRGGDDIRMENYLAAGLLFTSVFRQAGEDRNWGEAYQILCDLYLYRGEWTQTGHTAFKKLFWGLVWIMAVHSAYDAPAMFTDIRELYRRAEIGETSKSELDEIQRFLKMLRHFYLRNSSFGDGIYTRNGYQVSYETQMQGFLAVYFGMVETDVFLNVNLEDDLGVLKGILSREEI